MFDNDARQSLRVVLGLIWANAVFRNAKCT